MKKTSTLFLKGVIVLAGLVVLGSCIFLLTILGEAGPYRLIFVGMCIAAAPFFIALFETLKLLSYIDRDEAFSTLSVKALGNINKCAITISTLYTLGLPFILYAAERDDAPGAVLMGLIVVFASIVIAVFATVLRRLLINAIEIKSENDLTV